MKVDSHLENQKAHILSFISLPKPNVDYSLAEVRGCDLEVARGGGPCSPGR